MYPSTLRRMAVFDHSARFRGAKRVKMSGDSLPKGEGARPVAGNVEAPPLLIARRMLLPLLRGESRVRGNGCPELKVGSVNFHAAPNPGSESGVLSLRHTSGINMVYVWCTDGVCMG